MGKKQLRQRENLVKPFLTCVCEDLLRTSNNQSTTTVEHVHHILTAAVAVAVARCWRAHLQVLLWDASTQANPRITGFKNTPVTKYVLTGIIATSTFTSLLTLKPYTHIQIVPHLLHQWQWWRIPIWMATYSNAGEVLFACLTVYNLRGLERIFGSRKYAVLAFHPFPVA